VGLLFDFWGHGAAVFVAQLPEIRIFKFPAVAKSLIAEDKMAC
jgi:hypothetical protein